MNNIKKSILFVLVFGLFYYGLFKEIHNPSEFVSNETFASMNKVYKILSYPIDLWSLVINKQTMIDYSTFFHSTVPLAWLIMTCPLFLSFRGVRYNKGSKALGILQEFEDELTAERTKFGPKNKVEVFLNKLGLLKLTSIEKMLFYRFSVLLPEDYQHIFRKQVKAMNRNHRFFLNQEKTISVTSFDAYKFFFFKNKNVMRFKSNKKLGSEYLLVSGMIKGQNNELIAVDLIVENRIIKRLRYDGEYALDKMTGPFEIYDIKVNALILQGK